MIEGQENDQDIEKKEDKEELPDMPPVCRVGMRAVLQAIN